MKVGRNDPCTCGSGKKYKKCCMEGGNIIPFPGNNSLSQDPRMEEYKEYCEFAHENGMPIPSFMEFIGNPNPTSDFLGEIKDEISTMDFSSIDEVKSFMEERVGRENLTTKEDLLGITSQQMDQILANPYNACEIVEINENLSSTLVEEAPIIRDMMLFLILLSSNNGFVTLNAKGLILKKYCIEFANDKYGDLIPEGYIKSEEDLPELRSIIPILYRLGYIDILKTRIKITNQGYQLLITDDTVSLFYEVLETFLDEYNWIEGTDLPKDLGFIQASALFSLYILSKTDGKSFTLDDIYKTFSKSFPLFVGEYQNYNGFNMVEFVYHVYYFKGFCSTFGLIESADTLDVEMFKQLDINKVPFITTPLFKELFIWRVQ